MRKILVAGLTLVCSCVGATLSLATDNDGEKYSEFSRDSRYVAVRDGTELAINIYRPAQNGQAVDTPYPVIFVFTPYRARFRDAKGQIQDTGLSDRLGLKGLTDYGYVVAVADIRGKGASYGARRGFQDRTEALDGRDLVQWLAGQKWSTGKVGMLGCSYLGGATVQVASTAPPALKAIFTGATDFDKFDFVRRGGITAQFNTRPDEPLSDDLQSIPVDADKNGSMLREAVAQHAKNTPMAPLWYGMPYRDSMSKLTGTRFWEEVGPYTYLDTLKKSGIATYLWGNWQDEPTSQVLIAAANLGGKVLIGPGTHCVPPPDFDLSREIRRYFDHELKGLDNGIDKEPRVTYWLNNAPDDHHWIHSQDLPGTDVPRESFYLSATGKPADNALVAAKPSEGSTAFTVNYDVGGKDYFPFWVQPQDAKGLTFTGPVLPQDRTMAGYPVVHLYLAADQHDADVFAYLEDVDQNGKASVVAFGRLAATYRKVSEAPYDMLGLPYHSGLSADAEPLDPGHPVELSIGLLPSAYIFKEGHRIRVTVTGADPRQRNLEEIRKDPPPRLTVFTGGDKVSRVDLPLLPAGQSPH
jgi:uncharacterized protein